MIIIKITHVAMHPKPGELSYLKVPLIDQDSVLNYIKQQTNSCGKLLRKGIKSYDIG